MNAPEDWIREVEHEPLSREAKTRIAERLAKRRPVRWWAPAVVGVAFVGAVAYGWVGGQDARPAPDAVVEAAPSDATILARALDRLAAKRHAEAIAIVDARLAHDPPSFLAPELVVVKVRALAAEARYDEALASLRSVDRSDAAEWTVLEAELLGQLERCDEARRVLGDRTWPAALAARARAVCP